MEDGRNCSGAAEFAKIVSPHTMTGVALSFAYMMGNGKMLHSCYDPHRGGDVYMFHLRC